MLEDRDIRMQQFKRLTMPSLTKETTRHREGDFAKARFASQFDEVEEEQVTQDLPVTFLDLPVTSFGHSSIHLGYAQSAIEAQEDVEDHITPGLVAMPYENEWAYSEGRLDALDAVLPVTVPLTPLIPLSPQPTEPGGHTTARRVSPLLTIPFTPRPVQSSGQVEIDRVDTFPVLPSTPRPLDGDSGSSQLATRDAITSIMTHPQLQAILHVVVGRETNFARWESLTVSASHPTDAKGKAASKWAFFLELPHLLVYVIGAVAIAGLYLFIPLLNLLNATVPGHGNTLLIALGIVVPGELLVCFVLARTLPRGKAKKGKSVAQP